MRRRTLMAIGFAAALGFLWMPQAAQALTYELDTEFSGGDEPVGDAPWLEATITQIDATTVQIKLEDVNLTGSEFVTQWYLNFDPNEDADNLLFTFVSGTEPVSISTGTNAFQADGDGKFDILIDFATSAADRFGVGDEVIINVTCSGCTSFGEDSFNFESVEGGGNGTFHTAAKVQGIGTNADGSGWIGDGNGNGVIPEPGSMLLLGSGLAGLGWLGRRRSKKSDQV